MATRAGIIRAKRLAVGGKRKRCKIGKSCSAACVNRNKFCLVDMPAPVEGALAKAVRAVRSRREGINPKERRQSLDQRRSYIKTKAVERAKVMSRNRVAEIQVLMQTKNKEYMELLKKRQETDSKVFDLRKTKGEELKLAKKEFKLISKQAESKNAELAELRRRLDKERANLTKLAEIKPQEVKKEIAKPDTEPPVKALPGRNVFERLARDQIDGYGINGDLEHKKINWDGLLESQNRIGKGEYAEVFLVGKEKINLPLPQGSYANGIVFKKGEIGDHESDVLKKAGEAGLSPRLLGAKVSFELADPKQKESLYQGMIAMEMVKGKSLNFINNSGDENAIGDALNKYWETKSRLHKLGIAHNDSHGGNFYIDEQGKGKFIDFGLSLPYYRNALSEALGGPAKSDSSATRGGTVFNRIDKNMRNVIDAMTNDGFSEADIKNLLRYGNTPRPLAGGAWDRITDDLAKKYIDILYEGI